MNRKARRTNCRPATPRNRVLLDLERMEARTLLATFVVTNTSASPATVGSLPYEIDQANATSATLNNPNLIQFAVANSGQQTISLTQALSPITQPTFIQGYTEPGSSRNTNPITQADNAALTIIIRDGTSSLANGLVFSAGSEGSRVEGLVLEGFSTSGGTAIAIQADGVTVSGNFIGVGPDGTPTATTSNDFGVVASGASGVTIGGVTPGDRNVITGNAQGGVVLQPSGVVPSSAGAIEGNFIGTNADLSSPAQFPNGRGVFVIGGANNSIGGGTVASGNVVSFNTSQGLYALGSTGLVVSDALIRGNANDGVLLESSTNALIVGSTIGGAGILGNGGSGVDLVDSSGATVGGLAAGQGNLIAGNGIDGVAFDSTSPNGRVLGSTLSGNGEFGVYFLGTAGTPLSGMVVAGDTIQSNVGNGLVINAAPGTSVTSSTIGGLVAGQGNGGNGVLVADSPGTTIGGLAAGQGDLIAGNASSGVNFNNTSPNGQVLEDRFEPPRMTECAQIDGDLDTFARRHGDPFAIVRERHGAVAIAWRPPVVRRAVVARRDARLGAEHAVHRDTAGDPLLGTPT